MANGRVRITRILNGMKTRCNNPKRKDYPAYGGRGIKVCEEWSNSVDAFVEWSLGNGYSDELTIDRINNDKDYSPENCRWVTKKVQQRNQSKNVFVTINNEKKTCSEWAEIAGISRSTFHDRLKAGWSGLALLKAPKGKEAVYHGVS
jgi:hypothetical protein